MAFEANKIQNFTGKSFLGSNSAKPICGHFLRDLYRGDISQARVDTGDVVYPGAPIQIKNSAGSASGAGKGLNPNVLSVSKLAASAAEVSGFLLESPTDILSFGETAARPYKNQVVNVALIGSGVEVYLPADDSLQNIDMRSRLAWDFASMSLKAAAAGTIAPLGPVVDGVKYVVSGGEASFADTKCIRVRL